MSKDPTQIILRPVITEKEHAPPGAEPRSLLRRRPDRNKSEIKKAVEHLFKVKVDTVRTQIRPGKERRLGRSSGYRPDWKKAFVRLKEGEKMIEYFEGA